MNKELPKVIWMFWAQGWDKTPTLVEKCKNTWLSLHPDWTIHFLSSENLSEYIDLDTLLPGHQQKNIPTVSLSNVIRLALLQKYGGVWIDATVYCNQPLNEWLPAATAHSGFFAFANPGADRMLSTWFLSAAPQHPIVEKWLHACLDYWKDRQERHTYHWCHYLFGDLYQKDAEVKNLWDKTFKISADAPHYFLPYEESFGRALTREDKKTIDQPATPLFKLTFKYDEQQISKHSVLHYLLTGESHWESPIIIVGMHRSGTSLTASLLQQSGLDIGATLMDSGAGNAKGHYENMDFYHFHMRMLQQLQHDPNGWDEVEVAQLEANFEAEAKSIIEQNQSALWGWKDPRTTLFLRFWSKLLPKAKFLFVYRSPEEVIDSLYRRGTDEPILKNPQKAVDAWLHYNKLILAHYQKHPEQSLLLNVNSIIHHYAQCIDLINQKFSMDLNPAIDHLFEKELFHENAATKALRINLLYQYKPEVQQVYKELIRLSSYPAQDTGFQETTVKDRDSLFKEYFFWQWAALSIQKSQLKISAQQLSVLVQEQVLQENALKEQNNLLEEKEQVILNLSKELDWMKKSKFWKLRKLWQKMKGKDSSD